MNNEGTMPSAEFLEQKCLLTTKRVSSARQDNWNARAIKPFQYFYDGSTRLELDCQLLLFWYKSPPKISQSTQFIGINSGVQKPTTLKVKPIHQTRNL